MNYPPLTVYLAGDVSRENPWRRKVIDECTDVPIVFYCPEETVKYSAQGLTQRHRLDRIFHSIDKIKMRRSEIIFAYFRNKTKSKLSGTTWECAWRRGRSEIWMVCDMTKGKAQQYEFVRREVNALFSTLDEGIEALRRCALSVDYVPKAREVEK